MAPPIVPVTVVTGFLGAGKTTLLDRWLREYRRGEVAVIVNELGEVGIDGELLRDRVQTLVEIAGGCVCCTTYEELVGALARLAAERPRRIFVETSGAASPAGVVRAVSCGEDARLDGIVTVVDARNEALTDLAVEQLGYADVVVLSRADVCDVETRRAEIFALNPTAVIVPGARGVVEGSLDVLLARRTRDLAPNLPATTTHESGIESISLSLDGEVDEERFGDWVEGELARYAGRLFRMKGIVAVAGLDRRMILQGVADRVEITFGAPWGESPRTTRLVLVGFGLDGAELQGGFAACALPSST